MTVEKVVLTEEQAKAVQALLDTWSTRDITEVHNILINEKAKGGWISSSYTAANELDLATFSTALLVGYEVKTLEFVLKEKDKYNVSTTGQNSNKWAQGFDEGWRTGVNFVLEELKMDTVDFDN